MSVCLGKNMLRLSHIVAYITIYKTQNNTVLGLTAEPPFICAFVPKSVHDLSDFYDSKNDTDIIMVDICHKMSHLNTKSF